MADIVNVNNKNVYQLDRARSHLVEDIHIDVIISADLIGDRLDDFNQLILLLLKSTRVEVMFWLLPEVKPKRKLKLWFEC